MFKVIDEMNGKVTSYNDYSKARNHARNTQGVLLDYATLKSFDYSVSPCSVSEIIK